MNLNSVEIHFIYSKLRNSTTNFKVKVSGHSMFPVIDDDELIEVVPVSKVNRALQVGDIILYSKIESHLTVHRILAISVEGADKLVYQTKGDNNKVKDSYVVHDDEILGLVNIKR